MPLKKLLKRKKKSTNKNISLTYSNKLSYGDLINAESALGRTIFGPVPDGHQREFFIAKKNVWIWHENWMDKAGNFQEITVCYDVRSTGVFKRVNTGDYHKIEGAELDNFRKAAHSYLTLAKTKLYC